MSSIMTIRRKWINYRVYAPEYEDGKGCWDYQKARKELLSLHPSSCARMTKPNKTKQTNHQRLLVFVRAYVFESSPRVPLQKVPSIEASTSSLNSSALFN